MIDMRLVASIIANPVTVFSVVGALVLWAALSGWFLRRSTDKLARKLFAATRRILQTRDSIAFASGYESISAELSADPILGPRWSEYRGSLVLPSDATRPVRATTRAGAWFDIALLRSPAIRMDARYHAALPNLLVGAGLLFTFVGLAAALGTAGGIVSASDQAARNEALRTLLDTASFKFVTSLAGLALSILYALYRKRRFHVVERALDAFLTALEARVPLLTPAGLQQEANELLKRHSTQLEMFSTDLAVNLGTAFDRAFDARLGEHIAPLTQAMQRLAEITGNRNEEAMQAMLDAFLKRLDGGAGGRMEEVVAVLGTLGSQFESVRGSLGDAAERMAHSADAMAIRMGEGTTSALANVTGKMEALTQNLQTMIETTRAAGTEAGRDLTAQIGSAAARVADSLKQAAEETGLTLERGVGETVQQVSAAVEALALQTGGITSAAEALAVRIEELNRAARDAAVPLSATAGDLKTAGQAVRSATEPLSQVANSVGRAIEQIAGTSQRLTGATAAAERLILGLEAAVQRFEGVDKELANTLTELQTGLQGFTRHIGTFVVQTDQNLATAATHLGALVKGLQDTLEDFDPAGLHDPQSRESRVNG